MSRLAAVGRMSRFVSGSLRFRTLLTIRWRSDDSDKASRSSSSSEKRRRGKFNVDRFDLYVHTDLNSKETTNPDVPDRNDEDMTATWNFKPNTLDEDAQANESEVGLYQYAENSIPKQEDSPSQHLRSLRNRLADEVDSKEPDLQFIVHVHESLNEMIKEIREISGLLRTLEASDNPAIANLNIKPYYVGPESASWGFLHPKKGSGSDESATCSLKDLLEEYNSEDAEIGKVFQTHEVINLLKKLPVFKELEEAKRLEAEEDDFQDSTSEVYEITDDDGDPLLEDFKTPSISSYEIDQESYLLEHDPGVGERQAVCTSEAISLSSDDKSNYPPAKQNHQITKKAGQKKPKEEIHTYRPFKTIIVPVEEPKRSISFKAYNEEATVNGSDTIVDEVNPFMDKIYNVWAELPEAESRHLMRLALRQALNNLEEGKNQYVATILMPKPTENT